MFRDIARWMSLASRGSTVPRYYSCFRSVAVFLVSSPSACGGASLRSVALAGLGDWQRALRLTATTQNKNKASIPTRKGNVQALCSRLYEFGSAC